MADRTEGSEGRTRQDSIDGQNICIDYLNGQTQRKVGKDRRIGKNERRKRQDRIQ